MRLSLAAVALLAGLVVGSARADTVSIDALQTGGFYAEGATPDNLPHFQNYYVGYGTSPGHERTPERRSFFWFSLSGIEGEIHSATLHLTLPFGGLIYGKGPGDPEEGPVPDDPMEEFQLGATFIPASIVTSPGLTGPEIGAVFTSFATTPIASPVTFMHDGPPPSSEIIIPLDAAGLTLLNTHTDSDVVLTGWMPTWSHDDRLAPEGSPTTYFEASELIFGLTDVHSLAVPKPKLTIEFTPVPAPSALLTALIGVVPGVSLLLRRRRKQAQLSESVRAEPSDRT